VTVAEAPAWVEDLTPEALADDPYPWYARMREEAPALYVPWARARFLTRWDDCHRVGNDTGAFRGAERHRTVNRVFGSPNILTSVDPDHADLRRAVDPPLRARQVNAYIDGLARPLARSAVAGLRERGAAELVGDFFEPVSVDALGALMGLRTDAGTLRRWFAGLNVGVSNRAGTPAAFATADAVTAEIEDRLGPVLDELERRPDESLLSHMIHGGRDGAGPRPRERVLPTVKVILLGGMQEPGHGAAATLLGLSTRAGQLARVAADPALVPAAVNEGLRWMAPIGSVERQALCTVEVAGAVIEAGDLVEIVMASANRDERRYERPDEFDLDRRRQSHMAFGNGAHLCSGHYFSRQLERIALEELLAGLPGLALDASRPAVVSGWNFRAPKELHAIWDA
jgi:aromatic O-demethylase, cytochrome P450 subunit